MNITRKTKINLIVSSNGDYNAKGVSEWAYLYSKRRGEHFRYINSDKDRISFSRIVFNEKENLRYLQVNDDEEIELREINTIFFRSGCLFSWTTTINKEKNRIIFFLNRLITSFVGCAFKICFLLCLKEFLIILFAHLFRRLIAYSFFPKKPAIKFDVESTNQLAIY